MPRSFGAGRNAQGQILAIFAGGAIVFVLIVGLVIDGGNVFLQRRDSQNSADITAVAGAKRLADYYVLPTGTLGKAFTPVDNAYTKIATRMSENGCITAAGGDCTWTARYVGARSGATFLDLGPVGAADTVPPGGALGVTVNVTRTPRTYLLGIMGQTTWTVNTVATAMTGDVTDAPPGQILPIGLTEMPTEEGALYALTSGSLGPGSFGWLAWTGGNDPNSLSASLCAPDNPGFTLPFQFPGDPGTSNASRVRACLQQWVDNGQPVLIPIVLPSNDPSAPPNCATGDRGNGFTYCIVGLAAFVITGFTQPAVDEITGRFVGTIPYGVGDTVGPGAITAPPVEGKLYRIGLAQ